MAPVATAAVAVLAIDPRGALGLACGRVLHFTDLAALEAFLPRADHRFDRASEQFVIECGRCQQCQITTDPRVWVWPDGRVFWRMAHHAPPPAPELVRGG